MKNKKINVNVWQIVAIIFIILFVLIVIGGFLRAHFLRPSPPFNKATDVQIDFAKNISLNDLQIKNEDVSNYSFKSSNEIRRINVDSVQKDTIEVSFYSPSVRYSYIIDVQSGDILMYSKTEFYDGLNYSNEVERGIGMPRFFPR